MTHTLKGAVHETQVPAQLNPVSRLSNSADLVTLLHTWVSYINSGGDWRTVRGIATYEGYFWVVYGDKPESPEFDLFQFVADLVPPDAFSSVVEMLHKLDATESRGMAPFKVKAPAPRYDVVRAYDPYLGKSNIGDEEEDDFSTSSVGSYMESPAVSHPPQQYQNDSLSLAGSDYEGVDDALDFMNEPDDAPLGIPAVSRPSPPPPAPSRAPSRSVVQSFDDESDMSSYDDDAYEAPTGFLGDQEETFITVTEPISGLEIQIGDTPKILGRSRKSSEVVVSLDNSVSRAHCEMHIENGSLMVTDLGSANGTFVGPVKITPNTPTKCDPRALVKLGNVKLMVEDYSV